MDLTGNNEGGNACYLLLGSNVGDSQSVLEEARNKIEARVAKMVKTSSLYKTEPWGMESENWFYNQALLVYTNKTPEEILALCLQIEAEAGRERKFNGKYEDRALDIDILIYGDVVMDETNLHIPHPRLHMRKFALVPLADLGKEIFHPTLKKTIGELLQTVEDKAEIVKVGAGHGR